MTEQPAPPRFRARTPIAPARSLALALCWGLTGGCHPPPRPAATARAPATLSQNPSPMVERARRHERVQPGQPPGIAFGIDSVFPKPVDVFIPERPVRPDTAPDERTLLVHLFGAAYVPMRAVVSAGGGYVVAVVNLGGSSGAYERALGDTGTWTALVRRVREETASRTGGRVRIGRVAVSAFSAGYAGVRALLRNDRTAATIDAVILLDGLHTSYVPDRIVLAEGGALDTTQLVPFLRYARRAVAGETKLLVTHSEIFPGTFASTTETTDWLIAALGLARTPVLAWGPGGMQQLSEVRSGGLTILGFAGNAGPDHIDQLHGLGGFLARLDR